MVIAMGKFAYFRLEHASYNREQWGYGRVAEAAHYAANQNKRGHVVAVGIPDHGTSYDIRRAFLSVEKQSTRKNARLGDTLIVSLPVEVSEPHRKVMMERFISRLTFGGQTFAYGVEHTDHPHNPHFHVVLIDRHQQTGKSVGHFGHSRSYRKKMGLEPNVTEWMRMQWEETGNELFSEFGYDLTFDRRSNLERGLEPPQKHRGHENDNHFVEAHEIVSPDHIGDVTEMVQPQEEAMDDDVLEVPEIDRPHEADISTAAHKIRQVYADTIELNRIRNARTRIKEADRRIEFLRSQKNQTEEQRNNFFDEARDLVQKAEAAQHHLRQLQKENGKLKGIRFGLLGFEYKSPTRVKAELAVLEAARATMEASRVDRIQADYERRIAQLDNEATAAEETALLMRNDLLGVNGSLEDLDQAEALHAADIDRLIKGTEKEPPIDPEEAGRAWSAGEITDDELRTYCIQSGNQELLAELEEALEEERSLSH
jgi:hypothetical protein